MLNVSQISIGNNTYDIKDATARSDLANKQDIIQKTTLPTASSTEEGNIYQYVGATENSLVNGFFYKCVDNDGTYEWVAVDVQSGGDESIELTQAEYNALSYAEKHNGKTYYITDSSSSISDKADKVTNATNGNFAGLDASGNLTDSGIAAGNVATTTDLATKEAVILQTAALTLTTAGWSGKQQTITLYPTYSFKDANRNIIDITLGEEQNWADSGVLPASTTTTTVSGVTYLESITFECEDVPSSALTFKVTSMEVS